MKMKVGASNNGKRSIFK